MPTKQKSGLYRTKIKIGVTSEGKPLYKYLSGRTRKELEQARADAYAYYIDGAVRQEDRLFGEYAVEWFRERKAPGLAPGSVSACRTIMNKYILPTFGDRRLRAIRSIDLQRHMNGLAGLCRTTVVQNRALLSGIFAAAVTDGILERNPMQTVRMPDSPPPEEKRPLTEEERAAFVAAMPGHPSGPYVACLYYLGVRNGEALGLMWGDFDWAAGVVHIRRSSDRNQRGATKEPKTKGSIRDIPVPAALAEILRPLRGHPDSFVFASRDGSPLRQWAARQLWAQFLADAGISDEITPHYLRHNYITMCWESDIDPYTTMSMVGHASYKTTMDVYTHLTKRKMDEAAEKVAAMFALENKVAKKLHKPL